MKRSLYYADILNLKIFEVEDGVSFVPEVLAKY